jgi:hypothetical protein
LDHDPWYESQTSGLLLSPREAILVIILVQESMLVFIPTRGHISYFIIEGLLSLVREPILCWLVIILVQEAILIVIPTGGHLGYYPSTGGQQNTVETVEDLRRHRMSLG